jgi:hypothetical protein
MQLETLFPDQGFGHQRRDHDAHPRGQGQAG